MKYLNLHLEAWQLARNWARTNRRHYGINIYFDERQNKKCFGLHMSEQDWYDFYYSPEGEYLRELRDAV